MPDTDTQPDVFAEDDTDAGYLAPNNPGAATAVATAAISETSPFRMLMVSAIEPSPLNPRRHFDSVSLEEMVASIKQYGVLQPILVRPQQDEHFGEFFQIVMGERRWRAAKEAGLTRIPATIRENVSDADLIEMAMLENVQRQDLTPIEEAQGYSRMLEFHPDLTQEKMAERLGISQGTVSNALRLLRLPEAVRQLVDNREITKQHGIALAGLSDNPTKCVELALSAFREHWAVSRLDSEIKAFRSAEAEKNQPRLDVQDVETAGEGEKSDAAEPTQATVPDSNVGGPGDTGGQAPSVVESNTAGDPAEPVVPDAQKPSAPPEPAAYAEPVSPLDFIKTEADRKGFTDAVRHALGTDNPTNDQWGWGAIREKYPAAHTITNATLLEAVGRVFGLGGGNGGPGMWSAEYKGGTRPQLWVAPPGTFVPIPRRKPLVGAELAAEVRKIIWANVPAGADASSDAAPVDMAANRPAPAPAGDQPLTTRGNGVSELPPHWPVCKLASDLEDITVGDVPLPVTLCLTPNTGYPKFWHGDVAPDTPWIRIAEGGKIEVGVPATPEPTPVTDDLLTPISRKAIAALTERWNAKHKDEEPLPAAVRLEIILLQRCNQAGIDTEDFEGGE